MGDVTCAKQDWVTDTAPITSHNVSHMKRNLKSPKSQVPCAPLCWHRLLASPPRPRRGICQRTRGGHHALSMPAVVLPGDHTLISL